MISRDALKASINNVSAALPTVATGGVNFLQMAKDGTWSYGVDGTEPSADSIWAINPATLQHGWIAWAGKLGQEPLAEVMVSGSRPLPSEEALPELDPAAKSEGYKQQYSIELLCIAGEDEGAHVLYKNSSTGAIKLFNVYIGLLYEKLEADSDDLVALVKISSEHYIHRTYGKTFNPILEYVEWRNPDDVSAPEAAEAKEEAKPATRSRKAAAKPAPAVEEEEVEETETETDAEEDDLDAQIAKLQAQRQAKAAGGGSETEAAPRRRERR